MVVKLTDPQPGSVPSSLTIAPSSNTPPANVQMPSREGGWMTPVPNAKMVVQGAAISFKPSDWNIFNPDSKIVKWLLDGDLGYPPPWREEVPPARTGLGDAARDAASKAANHNGK